MLDSLLCQKMVNFMNKIAYSKFSTQLTSQRFYPWLIVIFSAAFLFYKYIMQVSPSIMTHELMQTFHVNGTGLGNLAATFFYTYFITQMFVGVLLDKLSPRFLSAGAILTSALGTYFFAHADNIVTAALARGCMGMGAAFATVSYMKLTANWFKPHRFAFIGGLLATAAMAGAIFGQAPLAYLVSQAGWRSSLVVCAWLGIILSLAFVLLVRDQPNEGIHPNSPSNISFKVSFSDVMNIVKNPQNWLLTIYSGLAFTPVAIFAGLWGNPFISAAYHMSPTQTAGIVSSVFFGLAIGGPVLGYLSDKMGERKRVMLAGAILSLISATSVIYIGHMPIWLVSSLLFLFGFGTGAFMLGFAIGKEINPISMSATVIALINTGDGIFGSITEPLVGKFLDLNWDGRIVNGVHDFTVENFRHALAVVPCYLLVTVILVFFIRQKKLVN